MIEPEKLAAFALMSGLTSLVPGPSMLFVMGQAIWRGPGAGAVALAGVQFGYVLWWILAALGLGTLAATFPLAFRLLAIFGALYLAWLGLQAVWHARQADKRGESPGRGRSHHPFRDGIVVALGNPKALIYIVALLPPFVNPHSPVVPQLVTLALLAMAIDVAFGMIYIVAGNRLAASMSRPSARWRLDVILGIIFITIALALLAGPMLGLIRAAR